MKNLYAMGENLFLAKRGAERRVARFIISSRAKRTCSTQASQGQRDHRRPKLITWTRTWLLLVLASGVVLQTVIYNTGGPSSRCEGRVYCNLHNIGDPPVSRYSTGRPPSVSWGRCWLKSEQRSFVIYRGNTYEQYGGYNLFQNAEFEANFSIKVWRKC